MHFGSASPCRNDQTCRSGKSARRKFWPRSVFDLRLVPSSDGLRRRFATLSGLSMVLGLIGLAIALAVDDAGALHACHPLRCDHPRGSLSRAQVRARLSPLPHAGTALAVGLVGPRPALALFHEQPRELRLLAGRIWEGNYFPRIG